MHGIRLGKDAPVDAREALPLLALNSATILGAEIMGRSYGGGVLKMEPREAASLPVPLPDDLEAAWRKIKSRHANLAAMLRRGEWWTVVAEVDRVLLKQRMKLDEEQVTAIRDAATILRVRRTGKAESSAST
jgi:hypothetical protein